MIFLILFSMAASAPSVLVNVTSNKLDSSMCDVGITVSGVGTTCSINQASGFVILGTSNSATTPGVLLDQGLYCWVNCSETQANMINPNSINCGRFIENYDATMFNPAYDTQISESNKVNISQA